MNLIFFRLLPGGVRPGPATRLEGYNWVFWRPGFLPPEPNAADLAWAAVHYLGLFDTKNYCKLLVFDKTRLVHRSVVFPRWLRYPFMGKQDLQIGDVWTAREYRGRGIASAATQIILTELSRPDRTFWYISDAENPSSASVAERAGFERFGRGRRTSRYGSDLLGFFEIEELTNK